MADCVACGRQVPADDRFCGGCGAGLGEVAIPLDLDDRVPSGVDDGLLHLDRRRPRASRSSGSVRTGTSGRTLLFGGVAVALVVAFGFGLFGPDAGRPSSDTDGNLAVLRRSGADADRATPNLTDGETASGDTFDVDRIDEDGGPDEPDPAEETTRSLLPGNVEGENLLGFATGLGLIVGSDTNDLALVDLDSGVQTPLGVGAGSPIGLVGTQLIVVLDGAIYAVDLVEPDPEAVRLTLGVDLRSGQVVVAGGLIWVVAGFNADDARLRAFAPDGSIERSIDLPVPGSVFIGPGLPEVVEAVPGGVYRVGEDSFRRVSGGSIVAAGRDIALVQECDAGLACRSTWYRKDDWSAVVLPEPDAGVGLSAGAGMIVGDDRWLLVLDANARANSAPADVVEVETGDVVARVSPPRGRSRFPTASPDGRWLATVSPRLNPVLVDLEDGANEFELDGPRVVDGRALLIERALVPELFDRETG